MIKLNQFMVVAFVTQNTPYEEVLKKYLMPSLEKHKLPHYIEVVQNQGSWIRNVAFKPQVIANALYKYPSFNIVSLDADAEIVEYPALFNSIPEDFDIACHYLDWKEWYGHKEANKELLSGTMFLRNNDKVKELVREWFIEAEQSHVWEQKVLEKLLTLKPDIKVFNLPLEYCYITTLPSGEPPKIKVEKPIILHHQVSRKLKKQIR